MVLVHALALALADAHPPPPARAARLQRRAVRDLLGASPARCWRRSPATCPTRTACSTSSCEYAPGAGRRRGGCSSRSTRRWPSTPPALARGIEPADGDALRPRPEHLVDGRADRAGAGDPRRRGLRPVAAPAARDPAGGDPARQPPGGHQRARGAPRPLTGLPNREHLTRALELRAPSATSAAASRSACCSSASTRFKELNETLGHRRGDLVLVEVGRRLAALRPAGGEVARLGGDEFAIVARAGDGTDGCVAVAARGDRRAARAGDDPRRRAGHRGAPSAIACHPDARAQRRRAAAPRRRRAGAGQERRTGRCGRSTSRASTSTASSGSRWSPTCAARSTAASSSSALPAPGRARDGAAARRRGAGALARTPSAALLVARGVHRARRAHRA